MFPHVLVIKAKVGLSVQSCLLVDAGIPCLIQVRRYLCVRCTPFTQLEEVYCTWNCT
jgi:hypothetical protein